MAQDAGQSTFRLPPFRDAFGAHAALNPYPQPQSTSDVARPRPEPSAAHAARSRAQPTGSGTAYPQPQPAGPSATPRRSQGAGTVGTHPQPQPGGSGGPGASSGSHGGPASTHQYAQPGPSRPPLGRGSVPAVAGGAPPAPPAPSARPAHHQPGVGLGRGGGPAPQPSWQPGPPTGVQQHAAPPGSGIDPARAALDASLVIACTSAIEDYRQQRIDKQTAVSRCYGAVVAAQYDPATHLGPYLAQLDQHDVARAAAAAAVVNAPAAAGAPQQAFGGPTSGDPLENAQPRARKHGRPSRRNRNDDGDDGGGNSPSSSDADDDDDDDRPHKRSAFDPKRAAFNDAEHAHDVSDHVQRTLDARDNYLRDLKAAKRYLMRKGRYPAFPDAYWESVLADRFVDFNKLLSVRFTASAAGTDHAVGTSGAYLHVPDVRTTKTVTTRTQWRECFNKWSKAVVFAYPHRKQELLVYYDYIERQFDTIHEDFHERVIRADAAIRDEVSCDPVLSFFSKDEIRDIGFRHISSIGSEVHVARAAPHPSTPSKTKSSKRSREICQRYNLGKCYSIDCKYRHVCSRPGCGGGHPEQEHGSTEKTQKSNSSGNDRAKAADSGARGTK